MFLIERKNRKGLLIQTDKCRCVDKNDPDKQTCLDESVFFYDMNKSTMLDEEKDNAKDEEVQVINEDGYKIKLDVIRGLSDRFYFSKKDEITGNDNLMGIKISINKQDEFEITSWVMVADFTGAILALEIDPLNSNDVYSTVYTDEMMNAEEDRLDRIYIIDNDLNLIKFRLERECTILETFRLSTWKFL